MLTAVEETSRSQSVNEPVVVMAPRYHSGRQEERLSTQHASAIIFPDYLTIVDRTKALLHCTEQVSFTSFLSLTFLALRQLHLTNMGPKFFEDTLSSTEVIHITSYTGLFRDLVDSLELR